MSIALVVVLGGCDTGRQAPVTAPSSSFPVTRGDDSSSAPTERPLEIGAEKKDVDRAATNGNSPPELQDKNRAAPKQADQDSASNAPQWTDLFDGKTLGRWQSTQFGGEGEVQVDDGRIVMERGNDLTGVTWKGEPPGRMNYEIELEAMRVEGGDFFCGLTFPVGPDSCSLICGGWGGGVTGLSSLNGLDASDNETSQWINYKSGQWYRIRVRVTKDKIEAWLDDRQIVNAITTGRNVGIRPEVDPSRPLGIATWQTTGAIRNIRWRSLQVDP